MPKCFLVEIKFINIMANEDSRLVEKIAFCSVLCAGFAYAGYNVVSKMCNRKPQAKENRFSQTVIQADLTKPQFHKSTQTDNNVKAGEDLEDISLSPKSVRERVNDLNLTERLRKNSTPISPEVKPLGYHGIPWSSPLGCAKYLSVSAENINARPSSPDWKEKTSLATSHGALNVSVHSKLNKLHLTEQIYKQVETMPFQIDSITLKTLNNLQKTPSKMTAFEAKNLVILLHSSNEDVLIKTLSTISNCAAFTRNQELFCESDCPQKLKDLLLFNSEAVKVGVTQAISNIANINRSHLYFQSHIPILLKNAVNGKELLKSLSLTALANLALDPASHKMIVKNVSHILFMARNGTTVVQLQALRLLVNLSCNKDVVPSLLMSEVPSDILDMIRKSNDRELLLRLLTFLANVATYAVHYVDSSTKSTLLSVLFNFIKRTEFSKLSTLSSDTDEDVSFQAKRLHNALLAVS